MKLDKTQKQTPPRIDAGVWKSVTIGIGVVVALLFGVFVWPTRYRYINLKVEGNSFAIREDRLTGKTWRLFPNSGWEQTSGFGPIRTLSEEERQNVKASCTLVDQLLDCDIKNETDYTLTRVTVSPGADSGLNIFDFIFCDHGMKGTVEPHSMAGMSEFLPESCGKYYAPRKTDWTIDNAEGRRQ
ncbi:MAG: hypothetical protein ABSE45_07310 [Candidatus Acidiferrales bacterium]